MTDTSYKMWTFQFEAGDGNDFIKLSNKSIIIVFQELFSGEDRYYMTKFKRTFKLKRFSSVQFSYFYSGLSDQCHHKDH